MVLLGVSGGTTAEPSTALQGALTGATAMGLKLIGHSCAKDGDTSARPVEIWSTEGGYVVLVRSRLSCDAPYFQPKLRPGSGEVTLLLQQESWDGGAFIPSCQCLYSLQVQVGWRHLARGATLRVEVNEKRIGEAQVP